MSYIALAFHFAIPDAQFLLTLSLISPEGKGKTLPLCWGLSLSLLFSSSLSKNFFFGFLGRFFPARKERIMGEGATQEDVEAVLLNFVRHAQRPCTEEELLALLPAATPARVQALVDSRQLYLIYFESLLLIIVYI